ncbi:MAG: hypothetical protein AAF650_01030 [Pseudomonadota bacterium]
MAFVRRLGLAAIFAILGLWGLLLFITGPIWSDHSPQQVLEGLADLDIRKQPGEPGSTAEAAGGVLPEFRRTRSGRTMRWNVMSGDDIATTMTAQVKSGWLYGSYIEADVKRGNAPDARTSPAFQSEAITLGLFRSAISDAVGLIGSPGWGPGCAEKHADMLAEHGAFTFVVSKRDDLYAMGCDTAAMPNDFVPVTSALEAAGPTDKSSPTYTIGEDGRRYDKDGDEVGESGFKKVYAP